VPIAIVPIAIEYQGVRASRTMGGRSDGVTLRGTRATFAGRRGDSGERLRHMESRIRIARASIVPGLLAGAAGGVLIDVYLLIVLVAIAHVVSVGGFYQYVASSLIGRDAYADPNTAWLGLALHIVASLAWGIGYALLAAQTEQIRSRPIVSGTVFGIVVMLAMQLVEVAANIYTLPDTFGLVNALVAHIVFFGIPVAYVANARLGRA